MQQMLAIVDFSSP